MLAAVYGRVSTMRQENDETIENQLMAIKDFIKGKVNELTNKENYHFYLIDNKPKKYF